LPKVKRKSQAKEPRIDRGSFAFFCAHFAGDSHFGYPLFYSPAPPLELASLEEGRRKREEEHHSTPRKNAWILIIERLSLK
jgi:hypothetical protein